MILIIKVYGAHLDQLQVIHYHRLYQHPLHAQRHLFVIENHLIYMLITHYFLLLIFYNALLGGQWCFALSALPNFFYMFLIYC